MNNQTDKENVNPNVSRFLKNKSNFDGWSIMSREPKVSKFCQQDKNWRKKILGISEKEKQIQQKLDKMLNSQKSVKQCMRTTLSQQQLVNSFISSENHTLQKYFKQNRSPNIKQGHSHKKQLLQIINLLQKAFQCRGQLTQNLSQQQLIVLIKNNLKSVIKENTINSS